MRRGQPAGVPRRDGRGPGNAPPGEPRIAADGGTRSHRISEQDGWMRLKVNLCGRLVARKSQQVTVTVKHVGVRDGMIRLARWYISSLFLFYHGPPLYKYSQQSSPIYSMDPREFGPPFIAADADIIFRSTENVDFKVHRQVLRIASPVFADMFALPEPPRVIADQGIFMLDETKDGLIVVYMPENEKALHLLLFYCYPLLEPVPEIANIEDLALAASVVNKYQLTRRPEHADLLLRFVKQSPHRAYAMALTYRMPLAARKAARETVGLRDVPTELSPEFNSLTAFDVLRLENFRKECIQEMKVTMKDFNWMTRAEFPFATRPDPTSVVPGNNAGEVFCGNPACPSGHSQGMYMTVVLRNGIRILCKPWLETYLRTLWREFAAHPVTSVATDFSTILPAYLAAANCERCTNAVRVSLPPFGSKIAAKLQSIIDGVCLSPSSTTSALAEPFTAEGYRTTFLIWSPRIHEHVSLMTPL